MRVLLVDDQAVFRDPVALGLQGVGFDVQCAESATQGLDVMARFHPQVVVADLAMPAINGLEFVRYLRSRGQYRTVPVILLTAHGDPRFIVEAAKLGVKDYLLKSAFSLLDLVQRIRKLAGDGTGGISQHGTSSVPPSGDLLAPAGRAPAAPPFELPSIPLATLLDGVAARSLKPQASKLIGLCASPEVGIADLEAELRTDPMLTARVLQTANTTAYRRGAPVNRLADAIPLLGLTNLRNVVASSVIENGILTDLVEEDAWRAWQNSLATARIMGEIDDPRLGPFPGSGYLLGLCLNLPRILIVMFLGDRYRAIRDWSESQKLSPVKVVERMFGAPLDEIYQGILLKVGLPAAISGVLNEYYQLHSGGGIATLGRCARVLDAATHWANALGFAMMPFQPLRAVTRDELKETPALGKVPFRLGEIRSEVMALSYEFTRDSASLRKILERPFFTLREDLKVAVHADPWAIAEGPVHQFLGSLCAAETVDLGCFDDPKWTGLVVLSDTPKGLFPMGIQTGAPLLVLHRVALKREDLPLGARVGALRLPCAMSDIARAVHSF